MIDTILRKKRGILFYSLLLTLMLGITSCNDQDDNQIIDGLFGNTWIGDLGFTYNEYPVESGITFRSNDYAIDEQYYFDGGRATTLDLRWWVNNGTLYLDYGSFFPMLQIRDIFVGTAYLSGSLFVDGVYDSYVKMERDY